MGLQQDTTPITGPARVATAAMLLAGTLSLSSAAVLANALGPAAEPGTGRDARRAPAQAMPAQQAAAYTLAATLTLPFRIDPATNVGGGDVGGGLCPYGRTPATVQVVGFLDGERLALVTTCTQLGNALNLVVIDPGNGVFSAAPLGGDTALAVGFDPYSSRVLRSALGSASRRVVNAAPVAGSAFPERTWNILPAADEAYPMAFASSAGGVIHGLSQAGVARFGPGIERRPPWVAELPSGDWAVPGSLAVDGAGSVYVQTAGAGEPPVKFSADGRSIDGWAVEGLAAPAGRVAGYAEGDHLALLERDVDGALYVRSFAPDGRTVSVRAVPSELLPLPLPHLVVGPGGQLALSGLFVDGRLGAAWLAADGAMRRVVAGGARPAPSHGNAGLFDAGLMHVSGSSDTFAGQAPSPGDVLRWARDGAVAAAFMAPPGTIDIALVDDGDVLVRTAVLASPYSTLQRLAPDGSERWSTRLGMAGSGLAVDGERVYAALPDEAGAAVVAGEDGQVVGRLDLTAGGAFWSDDLAAVPGGGFASVDGISGRIDVWDPRSPLRPARQVAFPPTRGAARVAAGPDGRMAVLATWDGAPGTVRVFDSAGRTLWDLASVSVVGSIWPQDIAYDGTGRLAVAVRTSRDASSGHVLVFEPSGPPLPPPATSTPAPTPAQANGGPCRVAGDKTAAPREIWLGETVTVTLTLRRECPDVPRPADIVLIIDVSGSMGGEKERAAAEAVKAFVEGIDLAQHRVGKVRFATTAAMIHPLSDDPGVVRRIPATYGSNGGTDIAAGLSLADDHLRNAGRQGARHVMVLISDGGSDVDAAVRAGRRARTRGVIIFTVGIGGGANADLLQRVASSWAHVYLTLRPSDLPAIYREIASLVASGAGAGVVDDTLDPDVALVPGSFNVPPLTAFGAGLRWGLPADFGRPLTLTYQVRPLRTGIVPTNTEAWLDYVDLDGVVRRFVYPVPEVLVRAPTSTPTLSPTPTATPTATPTRVPAPIYLPIALSERPCKPAERHADIALVIDASTSMLEAAEGGRTKLAVALDAVRAFLDGLDLELVAPPDGTPPAGDRASIVAFNRDAALLAPLTADRTALAAALEQVAVAPQTCVVCGMEAAVASLAGARRGAAVSRVIVLLTDGRSNPRPVAEAEAVAEAAKADGIVVFTIGLGADIDAEALLRMASRPAFAYRAPSADDLAAIYRAVAGAIPCPASSWWGGR